MSYEQVIYPADIAGYLEPSATSRSHAGRISFKPKYFLQALDAFCEHFLLADDAGQRVTISCAFESALAVALMDEILYSGNRPAVHDPNPEYNNGIVEIPMVRLVPTQGDSRDNRRADRSPIGFYVTEHGAYSVVSFRIRKGRMKAADAHLIAPPEVSRGKGVVINAPGVPTWITGTIALAYAKAKYPWVAIARKDNPSPAVVVTSMDEEMVPVGYRIDLASENTGAQPSQPEAGAVMPEDRKPKPQVQAAVAPPASPADRLPQQGEIWSVRGGGGSSPVRNVVVLSNTEFNKGGRVLVLLCIQDDGTLASHYPSVPLPARFQKNLRCIPGLISTLARSSLVECQHQLDRETARSLINHALMVVNCNLKG